MPARRPVIAGNWKCNKTIEEAVALAEGVASAVEEILSVDVALCPPYIALPAVRARLTGSRVRLGAQNAYVKEGAFTGEIAPRMLAGLCDYVILGHSERRHVFQETDALINAKVLAVLEQGLTPILCVGELLAENERGETESVVSHQVRAALAGVDGGQLLAAAAIVAYEPVWAIGTGKACHGPVANSIIGLIRSVLADLYGGEFAAALRIQYGGSVKPANILEFMEQPEIDGALVGGASLQVESFTSLVQQTANLYARLE